MLVINEIPTMQDALARLAAIGYPEVTVRRALPDWWHPDIEQDAVGRLEGFGYISQNLRIDLRDLLTAGKPLKRKHLGFRKP